MIRGAKFLRGRSELGRSGCWSLPGWLGAFHCLEPILRKANRTLVPGCVRFRGAEYSFLSTLVRATEAQEVTHSAATGKLLFPVGTGGRSGTDLILSPPLQLSGTNVQVTREHTFPSGINVFKRPALLLLPPHSTASGRWNQAEKVSLSCAPRI